jgi:endoglucanase Acf2
VATIGGTRYALAGSGLDGARVRVAAGSAIRFWPVPEGHDPAELAGRSAPVTGSRLAHQADGEGVRTTLSYVTSGGETAIARMPHQGVADGCDLGGYPSIYGTLTLCAGSSLTWTTPRTAASDHLDLSGLSPADVRRLTEQLDADIAALPAFPADTYFGGKALQRAAMLLSTADQLGVKDRADRLAQVLDAELTTWTQPKGCDQRAEKCFVYDPLGKGLIGQASSFGSEEYNDHHFHYGYFLYAAAVMAAHDPGVVAKYAPVLNLVAADIASSGGTAFPDRRAFDAYAEHSWASGTSPFADGNNQESVSEAINAYAGLALWARASKNDALTQEADWMLSLEAQASRSYWLEPDLSGFTGYHHRITVLNWGAKRDYGTWFSPEPAAKLGILLLPMSPTSTYLAGSPDTIRANVADAVGTAVDQKFGDYILMYSALAGPADRDRALEAARRLSDASLDDGMSRTYLLAWLLSVKA